MITRLIKTQIWQPLASVCWEWGKLNKESLASGSSSVWEKAGPPALVQKPDNLVPPFMSLTPFKLLPQSQSSEQVSSSMNKSQHGPLKKNRL